MSPDEVLIDGNRCPALAVPARAVVRGDATVAAISAASILAKTARDAVMVDLDRLHPEYGFAQHKGYPTAEHVAALKRYGPTVHHRRSFAPVRASLSAVAGA
jgi:ribonuclease HII